MAFDGEYIERIVKIDAPPRPLTPDERRERLIERLEANHRAGVPYVQISPSRCAYAVAQQAGLYPRHRGLNYELLAEHFGLRSEDAAQWVFGGVGPNSALAAAQRLQNAGSRSWWARLVAFFA